MFDLDGFLLRRLLPAVLSCRCGAVIPRTDESADLVNCFSVRSIDAVGRRYILTNVTGDQVTALEHDGESYTVPSVIEFGSIDPKQLHVKHFYGRETVDYHGVRDLAWGQFFRLPYVHIHLYRAWRDIAQWLFNRRTLTSRRRSDILAEVVHLVEDGMPKVGALDIMSARHGERWAGHPHWKHLDRQIEFHLEMLASSGELSRDGHKFVPTGLALKAIEETEEQERRHKENLRVQFVLGVVAAGSLLMAAAQAGLIKFPTLIDFTGA